MRTKLSSNLPLFISILCLSILVSSCRNDDETTDCNTFEWEYTGPTDPEAWQLCSADCGGLSQSPVNIANAVVDSDLSALVANYQAAPIGLRNNGHTIQFDYDAGSTLNVNGEEYELLQFHFHALSEHTVSGQQFPLEVHLVHQNAAGALAVVGVFFEAGNDNAFLANFGGNLPAAENDTYDSADMVNPADMLPADDAYYTYDGSLTTPPCSEVVTWLVMKSSVEASSGQIQEMQDILQNNYRPVQALNSRGISEFN